LGVLTMRRSKWAANGRTDVLLVCSSGGHLLELFALSDAWEGRSRAWVTFDKSDARSLLRDERVVFAHWPTERNVFNLVRNFVLAWRLTRRLRPRVVISTGAGIAVPFSWVGRLRGARVVYIESLARIEEPSLSCRLLKPVADRIYVQWPELRETLEDAHYAGTVV
jgi:UDP-N-acetylglucosamine:LPS N-acetylglucosamine transferase